MMVECGLLVLESPGSELPRRGWLVYFAVARGPGVQRWGGGLVTEVGLRGIRTVI